MMQSGLSNQVLGKIWQLSDIDKDGFMSDQEFALCLFLIHRVQNGNSLLIHCRNYVPPSYRLQIKQQQIATKQQLQQGLPKVNDSSSIMEILPLLGDITNIYIYIFLV